MTELKDLVGLHTLDAVDFETVAVPAYTGADYTEDSSTCRFRLNGEVWAAVEDPGDGYRSNMRELAHVKNAAMSNVFPPVQVFGRYRTTNRYGEQDDVLELLDVKTGNVVLEVGTSNVDDYYPSFVASFHPEHMSVNAEPRP